MRFLGRAQAFLAAITTAAVVLGACGQSATPTPTTGPVSTPTKSTAPTATTAAATPTTVAPTAVATPTTAKPTPTPVPTATPVAPSTDLPKYGGTLHGTLISTAASFDLHDRRDGGGWAVITPLVNYLVQNYQGGPGIGPDLAESWEISPDGKVYTFHLVKNAKWHDGQPVTSADVVFSFNRIKSDPSIPNAPFRFVFDPVTSVEAADAYTVKITLKTVSASFLGLVGSIGNVIYRQSAIDSIKTTSGKPIGSGPFKFVSWDSNSKAVLTRNTDYFKKDKQGNAMPYLDGIELYVIPNATSKIAAFRTGKLDVMDNVTQVGQADFEKIKGELGGDVEAVPLRTGWFYWLFPNRAPWTDVRVRKAFSLAFDRQAFNTLINEGQGDPYVLMMNSGGKWVVPPTEVATFPGYRQPKDADIASAKQLLQDAGFDMTKTYQVKVTTYDNQAIAATSILQKNLGVKTEVKSEDRATFTSDQRSKNFEILYDSNSTAVDDPTTVYPAYYRSDGNLNYGGWKDAALDTLIDNQETTLDPAARLKIVQDIQRKITNELYWNVEHGSPFRRWMWRGYLKNWIPGLGSQDGPPYRFETAWLSNASK